MSDDPADGLAAAARALPHLAAADLRQIGGGAPVAGATMIVIEPAAELGIVAFIPDGNGGVAIGSEGGKATHCAASAREDAVLAHLRRRFGHVSVGCALSAGGLANLYDAIAALDGAVAAARTAREIVQAALDGSCPSSRAALDMFCAMLGDVAGNLALTFGARGGVYLAGDLMLGIVGALVHSQFRARFEAKGRMSGYVKPIPSFLILSRKP